MIEGVSVTPLKQIFDERGKVMHMLRSDSPQFSKFGEIYFSCTYSGAVKAWHMHTEMTLNYAVVHGAIKFVLYDDRSDSQTQGEIQEIFISPENYQLVTVPPGIWNGFKGIGLETSIVANCSTVPHSSDEIKRKEYNDDLIPYNWDIKHK
mgnify:CR=1 FL=1